MKRPTRNARKRISSGHLLADVDITHPIVPVAHPLVELTTPGVPVMEIGSFLAGVAVAEALGDSEVDSDESPTQKRCH